MFLKMPPISRLRGQLRSEAMGVTASLDQNLILTVTSFHLKWHSRHIMNTAHSTQTKIPIPKRKQNFPQFWFKLSLVSIIATWKSKIYFHYIKSTEHKSICYLMTWIHIEVCHNDFVTCVKCVSFSTHTFICSISARILLSKDTVLTLR